MYNFFDLNRSPVLRTISNFVSPTLEYIWNLGIRELMDESRAYSDSSVHRLRKEPTFSSTPVHAQVHRLYEIDVEKALREDPATRRSALHLVRSMKERKSLDASLALERKS